ncbi:MAG: DMT family transporter [Spirochaetales bacterium]
MVNNLLLLLTAAIWGFAFVAQRVGMEHWGPFLFNSIRFALGALSLIPLWLCYSRSENSSLTVKDRAPQAAPSDTPVNSWLTRLTLLRGWLVQAGSLKAGVFLGLFLLGGASFQQVGIQYTTAGKAGFITGLYVVLVPILGSFFGTFSSKNRWIGAFSTAAGLYLLSVTAQFTINRGDLLVFFSAFFFTLHVLYLSWVSPYHSPILLSLLQYAVVSLGSLVFSFFHEEIYLTFTLSAWLPILYGGIFSVGIAYSLQVVAQKKAHPTHAAILLSMEGLFAALGGALLLEERLTVREMVGALLMLAGMLLSQWTPSAKEK